MLQVDEEVNNDMGNLVYLSLGSDVETAKLLRTREMKIEVARPVQRSSKLRCLDFSYVVIVNVPDLRAIFSEPKRPRRDV